MIDFPASPTVGQQFTAAGVVWIWDGAKWLPSGSTVVPGIRENRVINGDMRIDQRNNGAGGTAINAYTVDRWQYAAAQASKGAWQRVVGPASLGFPYALIFTSSSAYTPLAADYFLFTQPIEADMISDFAWGTASAQPVTLSFWAFSTLTGAFGGSIRNAAGTRSYPFTYSIPVANTWTKIVLTMPGDVAGTWVMSGNAASALVTFALGVGSSGVGFPANAWAAGNFYAPTGSVNVVSTNGATLYLTGVKLEVGSVATSYNRLSLAKSLADCQRYYQIGNYQILGYGPAAGAQAVVSMYPLPTAMRASPTMTNTNATAVNCTGIVQNGSTAGGPTNSTYQVQTTATAIGIVNYAGWWTASAEL